LSAGINNGNGSWTLTLAQLAGLTLLAPDDAAFTLTIQATATESSNGDAATTTALLSVTVHNVAPVITSLTNSASTLGGTIQGQTVSVSGTFTDAGILDTHTAVINWGDGTTSTGAIIETAGAGSIASNHVYAFGGIYTITVTLTDNSSASDTENTQAIIGGAGVQNGVLNVIGTSQDDQFEINQEDNMLKVHANFFPNDSWISFDLAGVQKIIVLLGSGNDQATVAGNVLTPLLMDGGAGDDFLNAGGGPSILLGGQGDDQLVGSSSRDILIGGVGADHIIGTGSDDILIDGTTTWDANQDALFLLLAEWNRQDLTYVDRIDHLRNGGGLNGSFLFNASTVTHDGFVDVLTGSSGLDWFWANLDANQQPIDSITGQSGDELIN
jgi:hypothetical protein